MLFSDNFNFNVIPWTKSNSVSAYVSELKAFSENRSNIFQDDSFHRLLNDMQHEKQVTYLANVCGDKSVCELLLNLTQQQNPHVHNYLASLDTSWDLRDMTVPGWIIEECYSVAMRLDDLKEYWNNFYVLRYLRTILMEYAKQLFFEHFDYQYLQQELTTTNPDAIENDIQAFYESFTARGYLMEGLENISLNLNAVVSYNESKTFVCIPYYLFDTSDLQPTSVQYPSALIHYDNSCLLKFFLDAATGSCAKDSVKAETVYDTLVSKVEAYFTSRTSAVVFDRIFVLFLCAAVYLLLDIFEHMVFLYTCIVHQTTVRAMAVTACSKKVPGPYVRKQINVFTYIGLIFLAFANYYAFGWIESLGITPDELDKAAYLILMIFVILRFLMHIHSIRLLPSIGHFVISTFMMGTNLLHFSAIFGIVVFIFCGVFHLVADKVSCPLVKEDGFETLTNSFLSTFQLAFGHGEQDVYSSSTSMSLSYVLYVVIVGLLLMNLIIAVMSSTATQIMVEPWKSALWQMEWLDEATSVEYTFSVLGLLCKCCCCCCGYGSHRKSRICGEKC